MPVANIRRNILRVNNGQPVTPTGIKYIRKLPIGNFVSFPYEIMRTSKNIMQRSITEMNSSNPYIRSIGEKRLFSFGTTVGALPVAAVSAGKMMHGVTENEMEALRTT